MTRYWVSWWSAYHKKFGHTAPPFQLWVSGERGWNEVLDMSEQVSIVAVVDADTEEEIWQCVKKHMPDYEPRFCTPVEDDFQPNNRFPGFDNRTKLI